MKSDTKKETAKVVAEKLVLIRWNDACSCEGWNYPGEEIDGAVENAIRKAEILSIGFIAYENKFHIALCTSAGEKGAGPYSELIIPRKTIIQMIYLKDVCPIARVLEEMK